MRISDWSSDVCSSDLLSAEVLPASIASNACFQASSCSGYRPCSRQYAERSASFIGAVWITAANLARASQRSGLEGLAGTTKPRDWNCFFQAYSIGPEMPVSRPRWATRSEEHTSALQSLIPNSDAVFC